MPTYTCNNPDCKLYGQEIRENTHMTFSSRGTIDHKLPCTECGMDRTKVTEDKGWCTTTQGRPNVCTK
jgi:hypothetical protein